MAEPMRAPSPDGNDSPREISRSREGRAEVDPLRIALLIDSFEQPRWIDVVVGRLQEIRQLEITVVVLNGAAPPGTTGRARGSSLTARLSEWYANRQHLLHALYERLDAARFRVHDDPLATVNIEPRLSAVPRVMVYPRQTRHCDYFPDEALEQLRTYDLDVAIRFGFRILKGDVLRIARHGVWSYHHGDNRMYRGGPPAFWEVMEGADTTGAILQVLNERLDDGLVLDRTLIATEKLSITKNRAKLYWKSVALLPRTLERLQHATQRGGMKQFATAEDSWSAYSRPLYSTPRNPVMARMGVRAAMRYLASKWEVSTTVEQWFLCYHIAERAGECTGGAPQRTLYTFRALRPPPDRYWADPFPVRDGDRYFIFAEEVEYRKPKGRIVVFEIDEDGAARGPTTVLERPYHLSYPCVFRWQDQFYMIPETRANRAVELYRATHFPLEWDFEANLLTGVRAADATVAYIGDSWWMFASELGADEPDSMEAWENLHVYYARSPIGPWTAHASNPVKSDVRSARPAGRVFQCQGRFYRPAQNCAGGYGSAITINEIDAISPEEYREHEVGSILPDWTPGIIGVHTLNADGALTVVDAKQRVRKWR